MEMFDSIKRWSVGAMWVCCAIGGAVLIVRESMAARPGVEADGTIHVPAFDLPESSFLSENRSALRKARIAEQEAIADLKRCPSRASASRAQIRALRRCEAEVIYKTPWYQSISKRYPVLMTSREIGGVYTEIFTPAQGVAPTNEQRVLINAHGGAFQGGSRTLSHVESIPIAAVGRIKVLSIDYRMAPEYTFPAASEDVAAVYRELLKTYKPENIGMYGCSAGGVLTAQTVAWLQKEGLPAPGAVAMLCGAGAYWSEGDSGYIVDAVMDFPRKTSAENPYFKGIDPNDPLAFPIRSAQVLASFPPSLLVTSTRDQALSSVVQMHSRLTALGIEADLHVWEGLGHAFFYEPDFPQSREVYDVVGKFFARHLGK